MTPTALLSGLVHWKKQEFFEAHQVWEDYWHSIRKNPLRTEEARYVQGLINLAVALVHFRNGNLRWYSQFVKQGSALMIGSFNYPEIDGEQLILLAKSIGDYGRQP